MLGDGHIQQRHKKYNNSRFIYAQSSLRENHFNYFKHVLELFKPYLSSEFKLKSKSFLDKRTNKIYSSVSFTTLTLPCFTYYKDLFYISDNKKIVHLNIKELLTPRGLAYWILINLIIIFDLKILNCFFFLHYEEFNYMNIFDLYCLEIIPIITYNDALFNKNKIILDNKGKAGIYCWTLLSANKSYIGSSVNLGRRLRDYLNHNYISHYSRKNMVINRALLKHGYSNFKLEILEYCNPKDLVKKSSIIWIF